ncbi:MAG TPA: PAS domain-containing protein [Alphaproteobacteria bacterium]
MDNAGSDPATLPVPADHPMHALAAYLGRLQAGRNFPRPRDFDILACRAYAGWIHLLDVINDPERDYVFVIHASRIADLTGHDHQGRRVSAIADAARRDHLREVLDRVLANRMPEFTRDCTRGATRFGTSRAFDRLVWPMSTDGSDIDRLLVCIRPI